MAEETYISLTIDGRRVETEPGATILDGAEKLGIHIPTVCHLKELSSAEICHMCEVEVVGEEHLVTACAEHCREGMEVLTGSPRVVEHRRQVLDELLRRHDTNCMICPKSGSCKLQQYCYEYGVDPSEVEKKFPRMPIDDSNPFYIFNPNLCILCRRCKRTCDEIVGRGAITLAPAEARIRRGLFREKPVRIHNCESCGNCVDNCPTGALSRKDARGVYRSYEVERVSTTCPHCAVGCRYNLLVKDGRIVGTEPLDGPANGGRLCVKGRFGSYRFVQSGDRLRQPLIKDRATGRFREAGWNEAMELVASRFLELKKQYGGDALAGFACSRSTNEDCYMVQKLVRTCFGTNNVDNCARVCHSATVAGLTMTLGSGASTNTIKDITADVDAILLVGSNPEEAHPVIGMQIRGAVRRGAKIIVVDPRDIDLAKRADVHLKLKPGTNVAFANGMMHVFIEEGLVDEEFVRTRTEGFEQLREIVKDYTPERVAEICGIQADDLRRAARIYATAKKAPVIYCLGVTEHSRGTEGVMSMSNMAMMVGKLGREGCGVNPLRGQNNVQGACDMGAIPTDLPGYQPVFRDGKVNEKAIRKFEKAWGCRLSRTSGLRATDVWPAVFEGRVRGLYICGEDPVVTDPDTGHTIEALKSLDFLVVQELFLTETARYADVVLPGASYAEKNGTFTNTERRIQMVHQAIPPVARLDTDIIIDLMNRMGYPQPRLTPALIMNEIAALAPIYGGVSHERLDSEETAGQGLQWPCPDRKHPGTDILHRDGFTRGLGWFYPARYTPSAEQTSLDYPILMSTGRILYHYNTRAMTGRTEGLQELAGASFIEIHRVDAYHRGVEDGDRVRVYSRRGSIYTTARVGTKVNPGEAWMPFHFPDGNCNWLTNAALDQFARIPEYKVSAVQFEKAR